MNKKIAQALPVILPNKKINFFVIAILVLGIISGSIFITIINDTDKNLIIEQIKNFFNNINSNSLNNGLALKNSLIINYTFIILMWILGLSLIGIIINTFLVYLKGFIVGFSLSALIITFGFKGLPVALIYTISYTIINLFTIVLLGTYTIIVTSYLLKQIINKTFNKNNIIRKYIIVLGLSCLITLFSSLLEVFLFPSLIKIIIKLYV